MRPMTARLSTRTFLAAAAALLAVQALTLHLLGQPFIAAIGFRLWANNPLGPDNSQQLADWYSFSHIVHGFILYGVLRIVLPRQPVALRLLLAMGAEIAWEIIENTPYVIAVYRHQALAALYRGDSVVNSVSDTVMMALGFLAAARLPWWATFLLAVALEGLAAVVIRDGLILNIINFLVSWPALEHWQAGYHK
jgi:hypothetical protein